MRDYLLDLEELRQNLEWLLRRDLLEKLVELEELLNASYVKRHKELLEERVARGVMDSDKITIEECDCTYAEKAKEMFLKFQEKPIAKLIEKIYKTYLEER